MRKLNRTQADTFSILLRHNGYNPAEMSLKDTVDATRVIDEWFRNHFVTYSRRYLAEGILALQKMEANSE